MRKNPVRHHYIPKFLLRPFCCDEEKKYLMYYDRVSKKLSKESITDVFMFKNLYTDTINHPDKPATIENKLAQFENEASQIISKFREEDEVTITIQEEEKLKLFFAIMGFRARRTEKQFGSDISPLGERIYSIYQEDRNYIDLWKRNLEAIIGCRSLEDVINNNDVDGIIKEYMIRDIRGITGKFFVVAERKGNEEFLLADSYPTVIEGGSPDGKIRGDLYSIFPISPRRVLLLIYNEAVASNTGFNEFFFKGPQLCNHRTSHRFQVKKMYEEKVKYINEMVFGAATEGAVMADPKRVSIINNSGKR